VVPVDEVRGTVGAGQVHTGQIEFGIDEAAGGEDHGVIAVGELLEVEVDTVFDVRDQSDVAAAECLDQRRDDAVDSRSVARASRADECEGRRQAIEEIDAQIRITLRLRHEVSSVGPSRAGAVYGHPEGTSQSHTSLVSRPRVYRQC